MSQNEITVQRLTEHWRTYPRLQAEDIFKYLFQSSFGCEHLVTNEAAALNYVTREYGGTDKNAPPRTEALDGKYSRVHLSWLNAGLSAETLTKIFCASAKSEPNGRDELLQKLEVSTEIVKNGDLPLDAPTFLTALTEWRDLGFPALHHSEVFRSEYRPAYRVVANEYATFLPLFAEIDRLLVKGDAIVAIEGGSASGKSTLADMLKRIYGCNVFHTDDFFLRPEQRTPRRLAEVGGNLDRERFSDEVLIPLSKGQPISYRKFDCQTGNLAKPITVVGAPLTIIEGAYSMHPDLSPYYGLSVFLDVDPRLQSERIMKRNSPLFARRFFDEWIPLENRYFSEMRIKDSCDLTFKIEDTF